MDKHEHHEPKHVSSESHHKSHEQKTDELKPVDSKKSIITVLVIIGIILIILSAILLMSKYISRNNNSVTYNNYVFTKFEGNKWMTQQMIRGQLYNIPFYNNPTQVLDIPIDPMSIYRIRNFSYNHNGTVYVSIDPNESSKVVLGAVEYVRILGTVYNIYNMNVKSAFNSLPNQTTDYPIVTCKDQSKDILVIYQTTSNKNLVSVKGNCVTIESINASESIRVADAFAFKLLNIIPLDK